MSAPHGPAPGGVVGLVAPHGVSGVSSAMARLAGLRQPHEAWRVLAIGPEPLSAGDLPGAETPGFGTLAWPPGTRPVDQVRLVRDRLRAMNASVVSPNFLVQGFVAAALDRHRGRRVAAIFHGSELAAEDLYQRVAPLSDAWRAVSGAIRDRVARYAPGGGVLPPGIEVPAEAAPLPCTAGAGEPLRLLYAGWLDERVKRVMDLVSLAGGLHERGVAFNLTIAGRGPAGARLAGAMAAHIAAGRVRMAGPVPHREMDELHRSHDCLVLVSLMEGMPTVVMEAMARGRPVAITTGCGGALELVRDGVEGIVAPVGEMGALAGRLEELNACRDDLAWMGGRAREAALRECDIRALAPRFDALVREAAGAVGGAGGAAGAPGIAELWGRMLGAMELLGESTPSELCGLLLEWLADLGVSGVLVHESEGMRALVDVLAGGAGGGGVVAGTVRSRGGGGPARGAWLGWPRLDADEVPRGSLVVTAAPAEAEAAMEGRAHLLPLVPARVPTFACRRMLSAAAELRRRGCARVVLYGAGKHTRKVAGVLVEVPEIVGIVDDRAGAPGGPGGRLWGWPVCTPAEAGSLGFDGVILSSDEHERGMMERAREWAGARPVIALYAPIERPGGVIPAEAMAGV